jgi:hypothetical protein
VSVGVFENRTLFGAVAGSLASIGLMYGGQLWSTTAIAACGGDSCTAETGFSYVVAVLPVTFVVGMALFVLIARWAGGRPAADSTAHAEMAVGLGIVVGLGLVILVPTSATSQLWWWFTRLAPGVAGALAMLASQRTSIAG